ncbi:MAG: methionyl-tRNA formyltransferase [Opitutaceae bacterium]|mgnify:FL=1|nr:methionyl-tRNA formyltransferase [Opitutaceae bacterium]
MKQRMIFMGSDPISLPLLELIQSGRCGDIEIAGLYTQPDRPKGRGKKVVANEIKLWAEENGIPVFQPERMRKADRLAIADMRVDMILVMAFGHMLSQVLIDTPSKSIWNLHTSILPKYRGASPIQCAVASGDSATGVTLMKVALEMDAGPILDVETVDIRRLDTALDVESKLSQACVPLIERNLSRIFTGEVEPIDQQAKAATYVRKLGKDDGDLDFSQSAQILANRINGLFPWPGTRVFHGEVAIKVGLADFVLESRDGIAGEVLGLEEDGLAIACGSGLLYLKRLQRPGGKMLDAEAFVRGYDLAEGTVLESRSMSTLVS